MFPDQQNQNGGQPIQPSAQPQQYQPAPQYGVNSAPQQAANGQYEVVPPLPVAAATGQHNGHNPYEFIVNPNTAGKKSGLFGGDKFLRRIAYLVGGTILLIGVAAIALSVLVPNKSSTPALTSIAQKQQELIRVATVGTNQAVSQTTKNLAVNTQLAISSSQSNTLDYLSTHGTKLNPKVLALDQSAQTDQTLASAQATSTFDNALEQLLESQLTSYATSLQTTYQSTKTAAIKSLLQKDYTTAELLLDQIKDQG